MPNEEGKKEKEAAERIGGAGRRLLTTEQNGSVLNNKADLVFFFFSKIYLFIFMHMSTPLLSSDTPEEGIRPHCRWL